MENSGLPVLSVVRTAKIATIEGSLATPLGRVSSGTLDNVRRQLRATLGL